MEGIAIPSVAKGGTKVSSGGAVFEDKELQILLTHFSLPQKQKVEPRQKKKKIIIIAGPTGVGKTQLSLVISKAMGGEIISADSMQVFRGMDIGTAKASLQERLEVPHHLIDSRDLDEGFNVVDFYTEATQSIKEIFAKGGVPVIVGGTGFYIHSLIYGPPGGPPSSPQMRKVLEDEMREKGSQVLFERLQSLDPDYAITITQRDRHKIVRALEIISLTNQKVSELPKPKTENSEHYDFRCWFIYMPTEILYPRIEMRCDKMIADGFVEEVRALEEKGLSKNSSAAHAIGYRQCLEFLNSPQSQEDWDHFVLAFKQASRRYAKRQFTWFRKEPLFRWMNIHKISFENAIETIIQDCEQSF